MKLLTLLIVSLMAISTQSYAASEQVPADKTIIKLSVYENDVVVKFTPSFANTQGCPESAQDAFIIDMDNNLGKTLYAAVLSSAQTGGTVGFGINGCKGHPKIYRVDQVF